MKKRFITHKKNNFRLFRLILWVLVIYLSFVVTYKFLLTGLVSNILANETNQIKVLNLGLNYEYLLPKNIFNPANILKLGLNYFKTEEKSFLGSELLVSEDINKSEDPIVYIYNTHQTESYDSSMLEAYNVSFTVETASFILKDYLENYGISTLVETASMSEYLNNNNLKYKNSYEASRYYLLKQKNENTTLKYFIDLHRDSTAKSTTTTTIDGNTYAKVLFVIGLDNAGYNQNLELVNNIISKLDERVIRGISKKQGSGVNGIYNQDVDKNAILIEIGGIDNSILEVSNTLKLISKALFETIGG